MPTLVPVHPDIKKVLLSEDVLRMRIRELGAKITRDYAGRRIMIVGVLKGSLHLWTRAFGIESPKAQGVTGDDVRDLFKEGRYKEIARYNARDLVATLALYECYREYFVFPEK